ncbi:chorismate mutase [Streptomyces sp. NBC_01358]|uniref:chorismate mutase n=1 Tax=Streptomyces sp. NBC_01358 TaxID=2903837 RepID=UPI002E378631|nr:chorismate mutase [Streptomyces sp. NBC_01358]
MQLTADPLRLLTAGAVAVVALLPGAHATAAPSQQPPAAGVSHSGYDRLRPLVDLSARRLATADVVASAKWGTGSPVDDPAREQQVLDTVARLAREQGTDPQETVRFLRQQIEANKQVQRAMHQRWNADPSEAPTSRPDLTQVREEINRINVEMVRAIGTSASVRTAPSCGAALTAAEAGVSHRRHLDRLHARALRYALRPVCAPGDVGAV